MAGLAAPRDLPPAIKQKFADAAIAPMAAINKSATNQRMRDRGLEIVGSTPAEFAGCQSWEFARWRILINSRNITTD